jgi:hypothetical protein
MRFMQLIYPGPKAESGVPPDEKAMAAMMAYNRELSKAGVLLALDGLHPGAQRVRIRRENGKVRVVDGPFAEDKDPIGGYWILQVKSKEEAVAWASRCPLGDGETLELRRIDAGPGEAKGG